MKESEQKLMENEQKRLLIINRMRDLYEVDIPEYLDVKLTEIELQEKIQKAHRSIENIGAVNMAVQSDYDEETDRLQMLERQRSDIIKSEENLRETIQRIDKIAREKFLNTFEQINTNFTKLFTLFFEGGEGRLELIGDPDPLEADIAIRAQPPGKRNQNLRMLSAGEKSLTAIALLFAIYQYKPSPYCILDEVDAPLDDVNIRKFTRVLHQFSNETQFIVVTHNKLTMESANYLYGVTMEQKGVSKLVSVQFEA
jgi:chromosome segregation protein